MKAQVRGRRAYHVAVVALYGLVVISNFEIAGMAYLLCKRVQLSLQLEWASVVILGVSLQSYFFQANLKLTNTYTVCDVACSNDRT